MTEVEGPRSRAMLRRLRGEALFRSVVAIESQLGWPIPLLRRHGAEAAVYVTIPVFGTRPQDGGGVLLLPPHARFTLAWPSGSIVAFHDHRFDSPWPATVNSDEPVGSFPHPGLPADKASYENARATVFAFYDELLAMMARDRKMPDSWWKRFADAFGPIVEPGLLPFYRILGPKFFARITVSPNPISQ